MGFCLVCMEARGEGAQPLILSFEQAAKQYHYLTSVHARNTWCVVALFLKGFTVHLLTGTNRTSGAEDTENMSTQLSAQSSLVLLVVYYLIDNESGGYALRRHYAGLLEIISPVLACFRAQKK